MADPGDGFLQAVVSGLAHHAGSLVVGYALTLAILALRQGRVLALQDLDCLIAHRLDETLGVIRRDLGKGARQRRQRKHQAQGKTA